jgi:hypothetical protein
MTDVVQTIVNVVTVQEPVTEVTVVTADESEVAIESSAATVEVASSIGGAQGIQGPQGIEGNGSFSRGGSFVNPTGVEPVDIIVWRCPFDCTVTGVFGYALGGDAMVNALRNADTLLASDALAPAGDWTDLGAVQNTAFTAGDSLTIRVSSADDTTTEVGIQVDYTKP